MKKVFVLSNGLEKFSNKEIAQMEFISGGAIGVPNIIYFPTGAGGRRCGPGQVWSEALQMCVARAQEERIRRF